MKNAHPFTIKNDRFIMKDTYVGSTVPAYSWPKDWHSIFSRENKPFKLFFQGPLAKWEYGQPTK